MVDDGREVYIEEMVGVYRADYDAQTALSQAKRTVQSCGSIPFTVTDMNGRSYDFTADATGDVPFTRHPAVVLQCRRLGLRQCIRRRPQRGDRDLDVRTRRGLPRRRLWLEDALKRIENLANTTA